MRTALGSVWVGGVGSLSGPLSGKRHRGPGRSTRAGSLGCVGLRQQSQVTKG
jgi:hypothetical protein